MTFIGLILLILVCAGFAWGVVRFLSDPMDGVARSMAPGQFVGLADGVTHYRLTGPKAGPVIVCIHGLTTPSYVWDGLTPALVQRGFRVLTYDLYGRGFSDRPFLRHDRALYINQLTGLLDALGLSVPVTLMGYSMGGSIATCLAAQQPERVKRLILLAPAGLGLSLGPFWDRTAKLPILGDWIVDTIGPAVLRKQLEDDRPKQSAVPDIVERVQEETRYRGYMRSVLSSVRHLLAEDLGADHARITANGTPVLAIWGSHDSVIPLSAMGRLTQINRNARQKELSGAGHDLGYTRCEDILRILLG